MSDIKIGNDPKMENFKKSDYNWAKLPVVGMALRLKGAINDSLGQPIVFSTLYNVGKHKESGRVVIFNSEK